MGSNEYSQPASKSSWDSQDFGDVNMVLKMAHFHKSSRPQWVKTPYNILQSLKGGKSVFFNRSEIWQDSRQQSNEPPAKFQSDLKF